MTIFNGTKIAPNIQFTKIWHLRNYVSSAWTPQIQLVNVGGDELGSIYAGTLKLKESWIKCAFIYNCSCHKRDWLHTVK